MQSAIHVWQPMQWTAEESRACLDRTFPNRSITVIPPVNAPLDPELIPAVRKKVATKTVKPRVRGKRRSKQK